MAISRRGFPKVSGALFLLPPALGVMLLLGQSQIGYLLLSLVVLIFFVGLVRPGLFNSLCKISIALGAALGFIMSHILLAMVFYALFTPVGSIMRVLKRDPLRLKLDRDAESYWLKREREGRPRSSYEKLF